jgi:hypothetical protein
MKLVSLDSFLEVLTVIKYHVNQTLVLKEHNVPYIRE